MFKLIFRLVLMGSLVYLGRKALQRWIDGPGPAPGGPSGPVPAVEVVVPGADAGSGAVEVDTAAGGPVGPAVDGTVERPGAPAAKPAKKAAGATKKAAPVKAPGATKAAGTAKKADGVKKAARQPPPAEGGSATP